VSDWDGIELYVLNKPAASLGPGGRLRRSLSQSDSVPSELPGPSDTLRHGHVRSFIMASGPKHLASVHARVLASPYYDMAAAGRRWTVQARRTTTYSTIHSACTMSVVGDAEGPSKEPGIVQVNNQGYVLAQGLV
jgi:hypothetical protein